MAGSEVLVDLVSRVAPVASKAAGGAAGSRQSTSEVTFASGRSALLDLSRPNAGAWLAVLDSLRSGREPAYVEVDPATGVIAELLAPLSVTVGAITEDRDGTLAVELIISQARHTLRRSNPRYAELAPLLRDALQRGMPLWVTARPDDHEIIDARPRA